MRPAPLPSSSVASTLPRLHASQPPPGLSAHVSHLSVSAVAHWLRLECGIIGASVGGVAGELHSQHCNSHTNLSPFAQPAALASCWRTLPGGGGRASGRYPTPAPVLPEKQKTSPPTHPPHAAAFKQQNAVHGLPVELSPEEVTLALERGWAQLAPALGTAAAAAAAGASRKRAREASAWGYYEEEDEGLGDGDAMDAETAAGQQPEEAAAEPTWRAALADGRQFAIPTTPAEAAAANAGRGAGAAPPRADAAAGAAPQSAGGEEPGGQGQGAAAAGGGSQEPPSWTFPATQEERHRYWVFRDLHAKG